MRRTMWLLSAAAFLGLPAARAAESSPTTAPAGSTDLDTLLETGRALWDEYAPPEVKAQFEFPDGRDVQEFLAVLENSLQEGSLEQLAGYELQARDALRVLRSFEGGQPLADWLEPRLDFLQGARELLGLEPPETPPAVAPPPRSRAKPTRPGETPPPAPAVAPATPPPSAKSADAARRSPHYSRRHWEPIIAKRPKPARADQLVPALQRIFRDQGVAPEWVWLAEVESSMNPMARSPAGARGLFQFMPATAERFGLRTSGPDERVDPRKSARAAAEYLRLLYARFDSWPLALAAYNAGEGRVGRALQQSGAKTFDEVAPRLPAETRLYVPKVLATVAVRARVDPETLPAPSSTVVAAVWPAPRE